LVDSLSKPSA
jgi:hypothetical protein